MASGKHERPWTRRRDAVGDPISYDSVRRSCHGAGFPRIIRGGPMPPLGFTLGAGRSLSPGLGRRKRAGGAASAADAETFDKGLVAALVPRLDIIEKLTALRHKL